MAGLGDLSVCIPYRSIDDRRREIFEWIFARYISFGCEVIVSDSTQELFNRSEARNRAAATATKDFLYFADADTLTYKDQIDRAVRFVNDNPSQWVTTQNTYYIATNETTDFILQHDPDTEADFRECDMLDTLRNGISHAGGYLVSRKQFDYVRGFDERFKGWGYEDTAFYMSMETLFNYSTRVYGSFVMHLEHPATRFDNPYIDYNREIFAPYQDAQQNVNAMLRVVNSR